MAIELGAPVRVSPLIKFSRWSLLLAGVFYGVTKHAAFSRIENNRRAEEESQREAKEAKLAEEKKFRNEKEIRDLEEILNPPKKN